MGNAVKIIFASAHDVNPESWIQPLQALVPQAEIHNWVTDGEPIGAQLAVVWNPPRDIFLRETGLKAVFNLGAGVDALFRLGPAEAGPVGALARHSTGKVACGCDGHGAYGRTRCTNPGRS